MDAEKDLEKIGRSCALVFSALSLPKPEVLRIETGYAAAGCGVVSANSAHRTAVDVPMIIPEGNPEHARLVESQRKIRGWAGFIAVKPNCSIQSYVPVLHALKRYDEALACFDRALALDPKLVAASNGRAGVLRAQGRADEALADYYELAPNGDAWASDDERAAFEAAAARIMAAVSEGGGRLRNEFPRDRLTARAQRRVATYMTDMRAAFDLARRHAKLSARA